MSPPTNPFPGLLPRPVLRSPARGGACCGILLGVFLGGFPGAAQSVIEDLTLGPLRMTKSVFVDITGSTNVDEVSKETSKAQGLEREDVYLRYGFNLGLMGSFYPDIDLNFSSSLSREKHFVRTDLDDDGELPFLGSANFDIKRTRGRYQFGLMLNHRAETEQEKQEVFIPAARRSQGVRQLEQVSSLDATLGWVYERIRLDTNYGYERTRFNEEFADGDENETTIGASATYQINRFLSASASHEMEKTESVGQPQAADPEWEKTTSVQLVAKVLSRPSLTYSVGMEKEDDVGRKGEWEPRHTVNLSDMRNIGSTIAVNANATYSYEKEMEGDDIEFTYSLGIIHRMPYNISQSLNFSREPVDTFGSTQESDQTTYNYTLTKSGLFRPGLSVSFTAEREITRPKFSDGTLGPEETTTEYITNVGWTGSKPIARWLTLRRDYRYTYTDSTDEGTFDEHRLTIGLQATL